MLLISALLALLSGISWSSLAWNLEVVNRLALLQSPEFLDEEQLWDALISRKKVVLYLNLFLAIVCAVVGLLILG